MKVFLPSKSENPDMLFNNDEFTYLDLAAGKFLNTEEIDAGNNALYVFRNEIPILITPVASRVIMLNSTDKITGKTVDAYHAPGRKIRKTEPPLVLVPAKSLPVFPLQINVFLCLADTVRIRYHHYFTRPITYGRRICNFLVP